MGCEVWSWRRMAVCAAALAALACANGQKHDWTTMYGKPVYYETGQEFAVAAGPGGTVYAVMGIRTPELNLDINVVKYDGSGNLVWASQLGDTSRGVSPVAMKVDDAGNAYVTGSTWTGGMSLDFLTAKLDADGSVLWAKVYDSPVHAADLPTAIAIDAKGNVCVTGVSIVNDTVFNTSTVMYDTSGNELWYRWYDGPIHLGANASSVEFDTDGNVCVGCTAPVQSTTGIAIVKYSPSGNLLWERSQVASGSLSLIWCKLGTGPSGAVYAMANEQSQDQTLAKFVVAKYASSGTELWEHEWNGMQESDAIAEAIALDANENLIVGGAMAPPYSNDWVCLTAKYDTSGNLLWTRLYDTASRTGAEAWSVSADAAGNVFIGGYHGINGTENVASLVVKYDASGNELWVREDDSLPTSLYRVATAALGDGGDIFVASLWRTNDYDGNLSVAKYSSLPPATVMGRVALESYAGPAGISGTLQYRAAGSNEVVHTSSVALDGSGFFRDPLAPQGDYDVVCTFSPNWLRRFDKGVTVGPWGAVADFSLLNGDANGDNRVNLLDLSTVLSFFDTTGTPPFTGDLNWDGKVSLLDLVPVLANYGQRGDP